MIEYELHHAPLAEKVLQAMMVLEAACFLNHNSERFLYELEGKRNVLAVMAKHQQVYVGFKLGYERRRGHFYSWMGGVTPEYRGQGIARELMHRQHVELSRQGYQTVRTQTSNAFKRMLVLNLKCGFSIVGTFVSIPNQLLRIMLEKDLRQND